MSVRHVKYLLIGGGVASCEAARAIRQRDPRGDLMLIGQEINRPYFRAPLSKAFLRSAVRRDSLFAVSADWFVENNVQLRTGRRLAHLDATRSRAMIDNGDEVSFDKLLIATGALPNPLRVGGADLPNIFYLRTIDDAEHLVHAIEKARREGRAHGKGRGHAIVIGGGALGVEIAGSLVQAGLAVDLAMAGAHPWHHLVGEATGRCLALYLENHGVHVHAIARAERLEGDGRVQRVVLSDGQSVPCDFAVAAVGLHVNLDILRGTPIAAENAILVNDRCEANVANIFAAGDCAAVRDELFGKHRIPRPFDTAAETGRIAGANMAGGQEKYEGLSRFDSEFLGLGITGWGEAKLVDRRIIRGATNAESPDFAEIGVAKDGRIAQVIALGSSRANPQLAELVRRRVKVDGNEQALGDPNQALPQI
jgi:NAD(P)H-nitrite reductase large subunit